MRDARNRAQLATSLVEAVVGALLILAVVAAFLWIPADAEVAASSLDRTAADALAVLDAERPVGDGHSRLTAACRSPESFEVERDALRRRLGATLPTAVFGHIETPYGRIGPPKPDGLPAGRATDTTPGCSVTIRVWYV